MKMTLLTMAIVLMVTGTLISETGTAQAETERPIKQQMHGSTMNSGMMGMMHGGMMGRDMMGSQGGRGTWSMGCNGMMGDTMMNMMSLGQQQEFLDKTVELRKQMMEKRFTYMEALRNPATSPQDLAKIEKEMLEVRSKMMDTMKTLQGE
jgi:hypothetical protein